MNLELATGLITHLDANEHRAFSLASACEMIPGHDDMAKWEIIKELKACGMLKIIKRGKEIFVASCFYR